MIRVCVIEDEAIIRKGLISSVDWAHLDCEVVGEASNGQEGLKLIEKLSPQIIILDINMPIMDGIELLELLPKDTYSIIVVSGYSEFEYAQKAIAFGVSEYVLKPVDHQKLIQAIIHAKKDLSIRQAFTTISANQDDQFDVLNIYQPVDSMSLNQCLVYIKDNINSKIVLQDLVALTNKSTTSLNNRFQRELGCSFNEYLNKYRIQRAIDYIKTLQYHLYEISEMTGFSDYKYFNSVFKKIVGVPPKIVETHYLRHSKRIL